MNKTFCVDFTDKSGQWFTYDIGAESLFDAAAALISDDSSVVISKIVERIDNPVSFSVIVKNHNDTIIYSGDSLNKAASEKRWYEYQTGNLCTVELKEIRL